MDSDKSLLSDEYFHLQKIIEDHDSKALTVKAWSVTFSAVAVGFAYDKAEPAILVVSTVSAFAFWWVEALVKVNQQAFYRRVREIENHFREGEPCQPLQISRTWSAEFHGAGGYKSIKRILPWPHVCMPHVVIGTLALLLLAFAPPG